MNEKLNALKIFIHRYRPVLLFMGFGAVAYLFLWLSLNNFISHSEFWSINSGSLFGKGSDDAIVVYYKSIFHMILKVPFFLPLKSVDHIQLSRAIFGIFACFYFFLVGLFVYRESRSLVVMSIYALFLLTLHVFTYNIFRVRADLISHIFIFGALLHIQKRREMVNQKFELDRKFGALILGSFLCTPKAVFSILVTIVYFLQRCTRNRDLKIKFAQLFLYFGLPFFLVIFSAGLIQIFSLLTDNPYSFAILYFIENIGNFFDLSLWVAVFQSLQINFLHYIFLIFSIALLFIFKKKNGLDPATLSLSLLSWLFFLVHSEKWDYYLAVLSPLLFLPTLQGIHWTLQNRKRLFFYPILVFVPFYMTYFSPWYFSNRDQLRVVDNIEKLLWENPGTSYYDSTGLVPRQNSTRWFIGHNDSGSINNAIEHILIEKPEFIFYTAKLDTQRVRMGRLLNTHYSQFNANIWVHKNYERNFKYGDWEEVPFLYSKLFIYDFRPKVRFFHDGPKQ